ncbi:MAG: uL15m family ribosomal protein, partial [Clostridia bacterium]
KIEAKLDNILALLHDLIANGGQLQPVAIAQEELAEVASEVAPVTAPEVAPITMIDTDQAEVAESDDVAKEPTNWLDRVENGFFKARLSFDMKMRLQSDEIKEYYSTVKNYLLSYGIKSRISQPKETFNRGRDQIARMAVNGKTLVIYLAIDPSTLDETYYHQRDCRDKKLVADVPTMIKIRSKLSVKKICDLLDVICEDLVIFRKPKYVETNFAEQLTLDGFSTVECKGFDYLVRPSVALEDMQYYNDRLANQLLEPVIATAPDVVDSVEISVDDIRQNFDEGELVDLDTLKQKGLCSAEKNALSIVESDFLDKKYSVFANAFTPNAVKMICLAGGQAYLLTESFEALNESDDEDDAQ